jgi:hypothetical protein
MDEIQRELNIYNLHADKQAEEEIFERLEEK